LDCLLAAFTARLHTYQLPYYEPRRGHKGTDRQATYLY